MNFYLIPAAERAAEGGASFDPGEGGASCRYGGAGEGGFPRGSGADHG